MNEDLIQALLGTDAPVIKYKGKKINAKWNREKTGKIDRLKLKTPN
jgi:hypothetical protein